MMMLLMVMPMMTPVMMVIPLVMMIKMFGANTREQAALRRLLISDPKLPQTRPTICISTLLINYFLHTTICISSRLINYFPAPAKYLSVATICSFSFQLEEGRSMFTK